MAHNLAGNTMAYVGTAPWHGLGNRVPADASAREMIVAAGLDWRVEKRPARGARLDEKGEASRYEIVRLRRNAQEHEVLVGLTQFDPEPTFTPAIQRRFGTRQHKRWPGIQLVASRVGR